MGVAMATGSYKLGAALSDDDVTTLEGSALLVVLLIFFALVEGVDAAAHIPINVRAKSVMPKIHLEKFGFLDIVTPCQLRGSREAARTLTSICWTWNKRLEGTATLGEHVGLLDLRLSRHCSLS
jgi:hypothetical protein